MARQAVGMAAETPGPSDLGVVAEVGSWLAGAYLVWLHEFCGLSAVHGMPMATLDLLQAAVDESVAMYGGTEGAGVVVVVENAFDIGELTMTSYLLPVPDGASVQALLDALEPAPLRSYDQPRILVEMGSGAVAGSDAVVLSKGLGCCVAVMLHCRESAAGGLAPVVLPHAADGRSDLSPWHFGDTAEGALRAEMESRGAVKGRIEAKLAGGARMYRDLEVAVERSRGNRPAEPAGSALGTSTGGHPRCRRGCWRQPRQRRGIPCQARNGPRDRNRPGTKENLVMAERYTDRELLAKRIADLWEGEDFLVALFESLSKYAIVAADFDGNVLAFNTGARKMYGWAPEEIVAKRPIAVLFSPEAWKAHVSEDIAGRALDQGSWHYEGVRQRAGGEQFPATVTVVAIRGGSGELVGYLDVVEDISERGILDEKEAAIRSKEEQIARLENELEGLGRLRGPDDTSVTAEMSGLGPISRALPGAFALLVAEYETLMDFALKRRAYKVDRDISSRLADMSARLGILGAGPKDVLEIHTSVLKRKVTESPHAKGQVYVEEGRLVLLELMGHVLSFYRLRYRAGGSVQRDAYGVTSGGGNHA